MARFGRSFPLSTSHFTRPILGGALPVPAFVGASANNNAAGAPNLTLTVPAGVAAGDIMIMLATVKTEPVSSISPSGEWTQLYSDADTGGAGYHNVYWRRATTTEGGNTVTLSWSGTNRKASGVILAFANCSTITDPSLKNAIKLAAPNATINCGASNFTTPNTVEVALASIDGGTTVTPDGAFTEPANADSASTGGSAGSRTTSEGAYRLGGATSNSTQVFAAAAAGTNYAIGFLVLIPPVGAASTVTKTVTASAVIQASVTKTVTVSAVVQKQNNTKTVTTTAVVQKTDTKTVTASAVVKTTLTKTVTASAVVQTTVTKTVTVSAEVAAAFVTYTKTVTATAVVQKTLTKSVTASALVSLAVTKTVTVDAELVLVQRAVPASDLAVGNWTASTGTDRYAMVDENEINDSDYIESDAAPSNDTVRFSLTPVNEPINGTVKIVVRVRKV